MQYLKRIIKLAESNYGRECIWKIEFNEEIIGELRYLFWENQFWFSYEIIPKNEKCKKILFNITNWEKNNFKYLNTEFQEYADNAFSNTIIKDDKISMRALCIAPRTGFEEFLVVIADKLLWLKHKTTLNLLTI